MIVVDDSEVNPYHEPARTAVSPAEEEGDLSIEISISGLENVPVYDRDGALHVFRSFYERDTAIFVFLRNFLDYTAIEYAEDLGRISVDKLSERNLKLVVIGCCQHSYIPDFEQLTGLEPVYTDPEKVLYTNLHLRTKSDNWNGPGSSPHVKSSMLSGILSGTIRAMKSMEWQDLNQQGGVLIVEKGGKIKYLHRDRNPFDHLPIQKLLDIFGLNSAQMLSRKSAVKEL